MHRSLGLHVCVPLAHSSTAAYQSRALVRKNILGYIYQASIDFLTLTLHEFAAKLEACGAGAGGSSRRRGRRRVGPAGCAAESTHLVDAVLILPARVIAVRTLVHVCEVSHDHM